MLDSPYLFLLFIVKKAGFFSDVAKELQRSSNNSEVPMWVRSLKRHRERSNHSACCRTRRYNWCFIACKLPNKDFDSSLKCCPYLIVSFFRSQNMRVFLIPHPQECQECCVGLTRGGVPTKHTQMCRSQNMRVFLTSPSSRMSRLLCGFNPWRGPNKTYSDVSLQ